MRAIVFDGAGAVVSDAVEVREPGPGEVRVRMVAADGPWSSRLVPIAKTQPLIAGYEDYYDWLRPYASQVDVWMTTYVHPLDGPHSIADWFAGSTLQPFLERLGKGHGTREIAANLNLSVKTIETHRAHIKEKLGAKDSEEMVRFAFDWVALEEG